MSEIDRRFTDFMTAWLEGAQPDRDSVMSGLDEQGQAELADMIDAFTDQNEWLEGGQVDREEFLAALATDPLLQRIGRAAAGISGTWPAMLPRLRERARLDRESLAPLLADRLGNPEGAEKIADYYHRMEWGDLPAEGVSDTVLAAIADLLDTTAEDLRDSGQADPPGGMEAGESSSAQADPTAVELVFTRTATGKQSPGVGEHRGDLPDPGDWDETDRLFLGG